MSKQSKCEHNGTAVPTVRNGDGRSPAPAGATHPGGPRGAVVARPAGGPGARGGAAGAIFALRKTPKETLAVAKALVRRQGFALVTRADAATCALLRKTWPRGLYGSRNGAALVGVVPKPRDDARYVALAAAGTSDLPVVEEAELTLVSLGIPCRRHIDIGIAGIHRLFERLDDLSGAAVVITVAGMEGALPSVIAGLVRAPVVAVPTSVGYGASLGGVTALLGMLTSCAPGVTVVNIDNGFGAAVAAAKMLGVYAAPPVTGVAPDPIRSISGPKAGRESGRARSGKK
ncbi:MAG: nickel pincer cofactor biosynthesis protein LarB [Planctomycetaceae bacterium]|nr:nickel pincer cofactor biosynthesis protein LarB [Planctomycetaceae bacterium]